MTAARTTTAARRSRDTSTASRILDSAERLAQTRGFNAFSYADVAAELGITKASLHYHFHGKTELGQALMTRYAQRFRAALAAVEGEEEDAAARLARYAELYADVLQGDRMCLCGMFAAEYLTLPEPLRDAVLSFFDDNETWLERTLEQGRQDGTLQFPGPARDTARTILGALEGAMLVARSYGDPQRFRTAASRLLARLAGTPSPPAPA